MLNRPGYRLDSAFGSFLDNARDMARLGGDFGTARPTVVII